MEVIMNKKRYIISFFMVFVFMFLYEFLVHGFLLMDLYTQTKELWRPEEEYKMLVMCVSQLGYSAVVAYIFTLHYEGKGIGEGVRFGLCIGMLLGAIEIGKYSYMPIPMVLMLSWVLAALLLGLGSGVVLSLVYRR
jgi:hypothetical protein